MSDIQAEKIPAKLIRKYHTRDPFFIAEMLNIEVMKRDDFTKLKGAFKVVEELPFIFINANLSDEMQRLVCAHELGHAMLHRNIRPQGIMEFEMFDITNDLEYDANVFAANLLLDEDEIYEMACEGVDVVQIAHTMNTNVNLVLVKLAEINKKRHMFNLPENPEKGFLGKIKDTDGY